MGVGVGVGERVKGSKRVREVLWCEKEDQKGGGTKKVEEEGDRKVHKYDEKEKANEEGKTNHKKKR